MSKVTLNRGKNLDLSYLHSQSTKIRRVGKGKPCPINEITPAVIHPLDSFLTFMCVLFKPLPK